MHRISKPRLLLQCKHELVGLRQLDVGLLTRVYMLPLMSSTNINRTSVTRTRIDSEKLQHFKQVLPEFTKM